MNKTEDIELIEHLLKQKENIKREISKKSVALNGKEIKGSKRIILLEEYKSLRKSLLDIKYKILILGPNKLESSELDLAKIQSEILQYRILLHNTDITVGSLTYRGCHHDNYLGDIGYIIDREYRGNYYAYKATQMISDLLKKNDIEDFWISTKNDNIPSIKTIEKLNGSLIGESNEILLYKCLTQELSPIRILK